MDLAANQPPLRMVRMDSPLVTIPSPPLCGGDDACVLINRVNETQGCNRPLMPILLQNVQYFSSGKYELENLRRELHKSNWSLPILHHSCAGIEGARLSHFALPESL
jgi:hypothetical protein